MADTVVFQSTTLATPPDATIVATDDCGGSGQVQIFKQAVSTNASAALIPASAADGLLVNLGTNNDVTVTGTVTATGPLTDTELRASAVPVSMAAVPTGGATAAKQDTGNTSLASIDGKITACNTGAVVISSGTVAATQSGTWTVQPGNTANTTAWKVDGSAVTQPVSGTFWQATQPVSAASLPLPSGASTAAKQPALGTAGTASADVITVQGIASMTALKVDGSAVTQPVSDASGSLTVDAPVGTPVFVRLSDGSSAIATLPVSAASLPLPSGAATDAALKVALSVTAIQATNSGDTTVVASSTHKYHRIEASNSHATVAVVVGLKIPSLNGGSVFGKKYLPAAGGQAVWVFPDGYLQATSEALSVNLSAGSTTIEVTAYYE